ncbi:MAG TPA: biotin/lipoyl-containing protein [Rhizomicrobium sp.]|nr:biotin/lipoyl-containing protein [Rhizomicrobium sp.]
MAAEIRIPRLGWTMEEGVFQGWLKEDGARIKSGDPIFVLEGEKTAQEIEAIDGGVLKIDPTGPAAGSSVAVGDLIGYLVAEDEQLEFEAVAARPDEYRGSVQLPATASRAVATSPRAIRMEPESNHSGGSRGELTISPRAARAAAALGVDWTKVRGTGRTGRIRERDVVAAASEQKTAGDA